jgi:superfamily II DNA or RNA helicase
LLSQKKNKERKNMALALLKETPVIPTPTIQLRPDQKALKKEIYDQLKAGFKRVLVIAPCSYGKTILFCQIIYDAAIKRQRRTLIVVPFTCLIDQTIEVLKKFGLTAGVIAGEYKEDRLQKVQIATTQTLARRDISWFNPEVILLDEVHLSGYCQWFRGNFNNLKGGKQTTSIKEISSELATLGIAVEREDLEFEYRVTFEEAKQKYKSLALLHPPDHGGSKEKMQELNSAWEILRKQEHLFAGKKLSSDNRIVIGLTATPWRLSKREELGDIFETQVTGPTPKEMIERGALVGCVYFSTKDQIDTKGVKSTGGDFDAAELETRCLEAVQSIVSEYKRLGQNRQFVCFAAGKVHAASLAKEFTDQGIPVSVITAETPSEERREIFKSVAELKTRGIININTCGIGFNLPEISCIIHSRPTKSVTLYIQMTGRGQRLCPRLKKTDCLVLDQAGNVKRHGFIEDVTYPALRNSSNLEKGEAPIKECENCGCIVHASARICPGCGFEFVSGKTEKRIANEKLQQILPDEDKKLYYAYRQARREAYNKNKKPEWARYEIVRIYKLSQWWPKTFWKLYAVFGSNYTKDDVKSYQDYLNRCCSNPDWIEKCMREEFGDDYSENTGR